MSNKACERVMKYRLLMLILACWLIPINMECATGMSALSKVRQNLYDFVADKDAEIGVAIIYNGRDTISVNGDKSFPMASVYKFPQALHVADFMRDNHLLLSDTCEIFAWEMRDDTWSPMRDQYGQMDLRLPFSEIINFSLTQSDNNACDILFRIVGGPSMTQSFITGLGFDGIHVLSTEDEMHKDVSLGRINSTTPIEMAKLMDFFNFGLRNQTEYYRFVAKCMENCETGLTRLARPISTVKNIVFGHKTGTGDVDDNGRISAVNDAGYINLQDGQRYAIAVLVSNSGYNMPETEKLIADISKIALQYFKEIENETNAEE